jgi:phosphoglycerol transferase
LFGIIFGSLGVYYAFFFCFFALLLGLIVCMRERTWISLQRPIQAVLAVALGSFINLVPNLLYWLKFGRNQEVANRQPWEASLYGLRLGNVIFPTEGHGGGIFAVAHERYFGPIGATEGIAEYWGIFTITGIALLLFFSYRKSTRFDFIARLRTLLVGGLLLGLVGGFGGIFNVLISPQIRCYNRISIYLATFGLFSLGIYSQHLFRVLRTRGLPLWFPPIFISCVVYVALSDQILRGWKYSPHTAETSSDRAFIENIEEKYPNNKMTLQLPYVSFPEYGSVFKMEDLSHLRVLLYAKHMSVSYGAIKGRPEAREIEQVSAFPFVPAVARTAGYDGVYIDRFGFSDNAVLLDTQLRQQLQENPVESPNGRLLYFSLR